MTKKYVIQDADTAKFWYGNYTSKQWTRNIKEAQLFNDKKEAEGFIINNCKDMFIILVTVYS